MPPWADSSRPGLFWIAPVNAPRSWPNSSLSSRVSVSAAQLSRSSGAVARGRAAVDVLGEDLLADAGLAEDEHADRADRDAIDQGVELAHRGRGVVGVPAERRCGAGGPGDALDDQGDRPELEDLVAGEAGGSSGGQPQAAHPGAGRAAEILDREPIAGEPGVRRRDLGVVDRDVAGRIAADREGAGGGQRAGGDAVAEHHQAAVVVLGGVVRGPHREQGGHGEHGAGRIPAVIALDVPGADRRGIADIAARGARLGSGVPDDREAMCPRTAGASVTGGRGRVRWRCGRW